MSVGSKAPVVHPEADTSSDSGVRRKLIARELEGRVLVDRFRILERIGEGAFGVVYRAFDQIGDREVAIKVLLRRRPSELTRFRLEFRALTDTSHPNLVTLHELFAEDGIEFFTMELVVGEDLLNHVRPGDVDFSYRGPPFEEGRLRAALPQLVRGLAALHQTGHLHRDLKPTNVLVREEDGRIQILDFGLVHPLTLGGTTGQYVLGSAHYMSPEQAAGDDMGPASDYYGLGVMLFEALTGDYPFEEEGPELLAAKQSRSPKHPRELGLVGCDDLADLAFDLLATDPTQRPGPEQILARLSPGASSPELPHFPISGARVPLIGREVEQDRLDRALAAVENEPHPRLLFVQGPSGVGKSMLLRRTFGAMRDNGRITLLEGRCYERDRVPYKGVDVIVDALSRAVAEDQRRTDLIDFDAGALARMFPALQEVLEVDIAEDDLDLDRDPIELRSEAIAALHTLLGRLSERRPVVLCLDDVQWCDADSAGLLLELIAGSDSLAVLLVASQRGDGQNPIDRVLSTRTGSVNLRDRVERFAVEGLDETRATAAARAHLRLLGADEALAPDIARESRGLPLFIAELAREVASSDAPRQTSPDLDTLIRRRVERLDDATRTLMELVAVAGHPLEQPVLFQAAAAQARGIECLASLRAQSLVRTDSAEVEPYHGQVREAVLATLSEEGRVAHHARLASAMLQRSDDPERLAIHLEGAGRTEEAASVNALAAVAAFRSLAFNRAAELYGRALSLLPANHGRAAEYLERQGDALANAGRGTEAAAAYAASAEKREGPRALELQRKAADQLFRSGRIDEAMDLLREVLSAVSLGLPGSPQRALLGFLGRRAALRLRGRAFRPRAEADLDAEELFRIDACWTAATGLAQVNVIMGQDLQARHLLLALEAGEPRRLARALCLELLYSATGGEESRDIAATLRDEIGAILRDLGGGQPADPQLEAFLKLGWGAWHVYSGRFAEGCELLADAERTFREECRNVGWELALVTSLLGLGLHFRGHYSELDTSVARATRDARERDDRNARLVMLTSYLPLQLTVIHDRPQQAREVLAAAKTRYSDQIGLASFAFGLVLSEARVEMYAGYPVEAWRKLEERYTEIKRSLMLSRQPFRTFMYAERCNVALAAAAASPAPDFRSKLISVAQRHIRQLEREHTTWARGLAAAARASLEMHNASPVAAKRSLAAAQSCFEQAGMVVHLHAAKARQAELDDDPQAGAEAAAQILRHGATVPAKVIDMTLPPVRWTRR